MRTKLRTPHPPLRLSAAVCCWVALVASSTTSHAAVITWTAGAGSTSWHTAGNWDLGRVPAAGDDVVIPNLGAVTEIEYSTGNTAISSIASSENFRLSGGRLTVDATSSFTSAFTQTGGELTGAGTVTVSGPLLWSGGDQSGSGKTIVLADWSVTNNVRLNNRTLENHAACTWSGGDWQVNASTLRNVAGAALHIRGNNQMRDFNGGGLLDNQAGALIDKATATGTSTFFVTLDNMGDLQLHSGEVGFNSFPATNRASITSDVGTTLRNNSAISSISGSTVSLAGDLVQEGQSLTLDAAANVALDGSVFLTGGTLSIGPSLTLGHFEQSGGTLSGAGTVTMNGTFVWSGGDQSGSGKTIALSDWSVTNNVRLNNRTLENHAACTWSGGDWQVNAATLRNVAGAALHIRGNNQMRDFNGGGLLDNQAGALIDKATATGTSTFFVTLDNMGDLQLHSGTLSFNSFPATNRASFTSDVGTTLRNNSAISSIAGSTVSLAGILVQEGQSLTLDAAANVALDGSVFLTGGTLSIGPSLTLGHFEQSGGTLSGAGTVTMNGTFVWSGGDQSGSGKTIVLSDWSVTNNVRLNNRTLENHAACTWSGGDWQVNAATLRNVAGAALHIRGNNQMRDFNGGGLLDNQAGALIDKATATGTSTFFVTLDNMGDLQLHSGTLSFNSFPATNRASFTSDVGTTLRNNSAISSIAGSTVSLAGILVQEGQSLTLDAAANVALDGSVFLTGGTLSIGPSLTLGHFEQSGGTLSGAGTVTMNGTFVWSGGDQSGSGKTIVLADWSVTNNVRLNNRTLENHAACTWSGGDWQVNAATLRNVAGAALHIRGNNQMRDFNGGGLLDNQAGALIDKATATGTSTFFVTLDNMGDLQLHSGTLSFNSFPATNRASFTSDVGTTLRNNSAISSIAGSTVSLAGILVQEGQSLTLDAAANVALDGSVFLTGGTLSIGPSLTLGHFEQSGGTLSGAGTVTMNGTFVWSGGDQSGSGKTIVLADWSVTNNVRLNNRTLENHAACTWSGGDWQVNAATLRNVAGAALHIRGNNQMRDFNGGGLLDNQAGALIDKAASSGVTTLLLVSSNQGTVDAESGTIDFESTRPTNYNGSTLNDGEWIARGVIELEGGSITNSQASITLAGNGSIRIDGGADALQNLASNGGTLRLIDGAQRSIAGNPTNSGLLDITGNSVLNVSGSLSQSGGETRLAQGTLSAPLGVSLSGGRLTGTGVVNGNVDNSATVAPGQSAGRIDVNGNYAQSALGALEVEIGGTDAGVTFDLLHVSGSASLGGELSLSLIDGFEPAPETAFDFLTAGSITGAFADDNLPIGYSTGCLERVDLADRIRGLSHASPGFTQEPGDQIACVGGQATFVVALSAPSEIQWFKDGNLLPGETDLTLIIDPVTPQSEGNYSVTVASACGNANSQSAHLTVHSAPEFTSSPEGATVCVGDEVVLSAGASGNPAPSFQWRHDGQPIAGATDATLTLHEVRAEDSGSYDVVATNDCDEVTSTPAQVDVQACGESTGACCASDGSCTITTQAQCSTSYQGDNTTCSPNPCPQPVLTGACCASDGSCTITTQAQCDASYQGDNTTCSPNPCPQPVLTGACCAPNGGCSVTTQVGCAGAYQGDHTSCSPNPCPQPTGIGACCVAVPRLGSLCLVIPQPLCARFPTGHYVGDGTTCRPSTCRPQRLNEEPAVETGACCLLTGDCLALTPEDCTAAAGQFGGVGSSCEGGCDTAVATKRTSWGKIKTLYAR